jgi:HSP20 family molecular chaperone IbpA
MGVDETRKFFESLVGGGETIKAKEDRTSRKEEPVMIVEEEVEEEVDISDEREGQLAIDVFQTPDALVVESPIAGVNSDDLDINITSESVTIRGRRDHRTDIKDADYFYQECYWGRFSRSVILPQEIDPDKAEAGIKNGVLTIILPKVKRQKTKKLKVKID